MAISRNQNIKGETPSHGKREMTLEEFKTWLKQFDLNGDGRISKDELRDAIRSAGGWFSGWKSKRGIMSTDANGDGLIDENEIGHLVEFARKQLGVKIVTF